MINNNSNIRPMSHHIILCDATPYHSRKSKNLILSHKNNVLHTITLI